MHGQYVNFALIYNKFILWTTYSYSTSN